MPRHCSIKNCIKFEYQDSLCERHHLRRVASQPTASIHSIKNYEAFCRSSGIRPNASLPEFVYVIERPSPPPAIKFGVSNNPTDRHKNLQVGCPDELILRGQTLGSYDLEYKIHQTLSGYRMRGEWFRYEGRCVEIAEAIISGDTKRLCFS